MGNFENGQKLTAEQLNELAPSSAVNALQNQIIALRSQIAELQGRLDGLGVDQQELTEEVGWLHTDLNTIATTVGMGETSGDVSLVEQITNNANAIEVIASTPKIKLYLTKKAHQKITITATGLIPDETYVLQCYRKPIGPSSSQHWIPVNETWGYRSLYKLHEDIPFPPYIPGTDNTKKMRLQSSFTVAADQSGKICQEIDLKTWAVPLVKGYTKTVDNQKEYNTPVLPNEQIDVKIRFNRVTETWETQKGINVGLIGIQKLNPYYALPFTWSIATQNEPGQVLAFSDNALYINGEASLDPASEGKRQYFSNLYLLDGTVLKGLRSTIK